MRVRSPATFIGLLVILLICPFAVQGNTEARTEHLFADPIDGLSVNIAGIHRSSTTQNRDDTDLNTAPVAAPDSLAVSAWDGNAWTPWQALNLEDEQDARLQESNLILFDHPVQRIRFNTDVFPYMIHPIRVSDAPAQYTVADLSGGTPRILSRSEWGANEALRVGTGNTTKSDIGGSDNEDAVAVQKTTQSASSGREQDCRDLYAQYPAEFRTSGMVTDNAAGEKLLWPEQYSPQVKLLVVHHTALSATGEKRSGLEVMRALYQYHAVNRGWGDIGYQYVVDDQGQIYEGRAGGDYVVGGHAYCNNVGTMGIALMGNFDKENPTQPQIQSLQWLLQLLGAKYHIDMTRNVIFHGKSLPPIVGHRQLVSTDCPGLSMYAVLDQVRGHVRNGDVNAPVEFPQIENAPALPEITGTGSGQASKAIVTGDDGLGILGDTVIQGRPGGEVIIPIFFRAGKKSYTRNTRIARVTRSRELLVWQEKDGAFVPVLGDLRIPVPLVKEGESVLLRVKVRLPMTQGSSALKIGSLNYTFEGTGRRVRTPQLLNTGNNMQMLPENGTTTQKTVITTTAAAAQTPVQGRKLVTTEINGMNNPPIRILLTNAVPAGVGIVNVRAPGETNINGTSYSGPIALQKKGDVCQAAGPELDVSAPVIRLDAGENIFTLEADTAAPRRYRGVLECRVLDGKLTIIDELPMESYLMGLAEEPDSEPLEKQKAFLIAARTYATYYLDPDHRKFPGKPYDGADSPAIFQSYQGYNFELNNPKWLRVVRDSAGEVMTYQGSVIKPPYFSADNGRTKSAKEAGWSTFPFAEIFGSKPDPWCKGMTPSGHGVGMSGCGAKGQALEGKSAEEILQYYYPGTSVGPR